MERLKEALTDSISPEGLTAIGAWLRERIDVAQANEDSLQAHEEVEMLVHLIDEMIPADVRQGYLDELCL